MKKRIFQVLLFFFATHASGQLATEEFWYLEPDPYLLTRKFRQVTGIYNEKVVHGRKTSSRLIRIDTSSVSIYDEKGQEIETTQYTDNRHDYRYQRHFDQYGNLVFTKFIKFKKPTEIRHSANRFDSNHRITDSGGLTINENDTTYRKGRVYYYTDGLVSAIESMRNDKVFSVQTFSYDVKGNLIETQLGPRYAEGTFIEYIYNDQNQIVEKGKYVWYKKSLEDEYLFRSKFFYNNDDKIVKDSTFHEYQKSWTVTDYTYNNQGNLRTMNTKRDGYYSNVTYHYSGDKITSISVDTNYKYNMKFMLIGFFGRSAMEYPIKYEQKFAYDNKGRLISTKVFVNNIFQSEFVRYYHKL